MKGGDFSYLKIADLPQKPLNLIILTVENFFWTTSLFLKKNRTYLYFIVFEDIWDMYGICMGYVWGVFRTVWWGDEEMGWWGDGNADETDSTYRNTDDGGFFFYHKDTKNTQRTPSFLKPWRLPCETTCQRGPADSDTRSLFVMACMLMIATFRHGYERRRDLVTLGLLVIGQGLVQRAPAPERASGLIAGGAG